MLRITLPEQEYFNNETEEFFTVEKVDVVLQHSLFSLSKWESEFETPFFAKDEKSDKELMGYVRHMIISPAEIPPEELSRIVSRFGTNEMELVNKYIEKKHTATTFLETREKSGRGETITSELIYYWMVAFNIPFECEHWHLNRLFALIRICSIKNQKPKKMSRSEIAQRNRELNAQRKAQLGTRG